MKKLLLSSVIMLGVCSMVSAQNASESKLKKNAEAKQNSATSATPQKAASAVNQQPEITNADGTVTALKTDDITTAISATTSDVEVMKQKEAQKATAPKAGKLKKTHDN